MNFSHTLGQAIENIGGRKYSIALWFAVVGSLALFSGHLSGTQFLGLAGLVLGIFGAANVGQKVGLARSAAPAPDASINLAQ